MTSGHRRLVQGLLDPFVLAYVLIHQQQRNQREAMISGLLNGRRRCKGSALRVPRTDTMSYEEQVNRTRRWLRRLEDASSHPNDINDPLPTEKHEAYEDYLYAFFQNCWHIKDWILSDAGAPPKLQDAVKKVDEQGVLIPLMLCSGVANGSKHLRQTRDPKRRATTIGEIEVDIDPKGNSKTTYTYKVVDDFGTSYEAMQLARQAFAEWEKIITANSNPPDAGAVA